MPVTAKDLRFNISTLFDVIRKGENVLITYKGKAKAKLVPYNDDSFDKKDDSIFGLWSDREDDVDEFVHNLRRDREFGI